MNGLRHRELRDTQVLFRTSDRSSKSRTQDIAHGIRHRACHCRKWICVVSVLLCCFHRDHFISGSCATALPIRMGRKTAKGFLLSPKASPFQSFIDLSSTGLCFSVIVAVISRNRSSQNGLFLLSNVSNIERKSGSALFTPSEVCFRVRISLLFL